MDTFRHVVKARNKLTRIPSLTGIDMIDTQSVRTGGPPWILHNRGCGLCFRPEMQMVNATL